MLETSAEKRNCNYKCNCNDNNTAEDVVPSMELPEMKEGPRDCKREEMIMKIKELNFAVI